MLNNDLGIVIISLNNCLEDVLKTEENLMENGYDNNDYVIAINKKIKNEELIKYCQKNKLNWYEYSNLVEVYENSTKYLNVEYLLFAKEGDTYKGINKEKIIKRVSEKKYENIFIFPIKYDNGKYRLNANLRKKDQINIEKNPEKIWININSCIISTKILNQINIQNCSDYIFEENFLTKLIIMNGGYSVINKLKLIVSDYLEDSKIAKNEHYDKEWYDSRIQIIENLIQFSKIEYTQYICMYILKNCINYNVNMNNKHILKDKGLLDFFSKIKNLMQNIDDKIIMNTFGNKRVNYFLLRLKYGKINDDIEYTESLNSICVENNNKFIFNASDTKIKILLMDYVDKKLVVTAIFPFPFDEKKFEIYAQYKEQIFKAEKNFLYSKYKAFGETLYKNYVFDVKIPLTYSEEKEYIEFYIKGKKANIKLDLDFNKPLSRLNKLKYSYWNCGKFTLNYRKKSILVMNNSKLRYMKREFNYIKSLLKSKNKDRKKAGKIRILYHITKPFFLKEIWLFEDKIYKAGDNGEYLYTYASKQRDGIKKYYILKKDCIDAKRFKKEHKKYVNYGSLRHKLIFLNSNIIFETHNNVTKHHDFDEKKEKYFRDLFNSKNFCIQHGLTVQNIPHLVNRINDNLMRFFLASPIEYNNMLNEEFAYKGGYEKILKITGSPRYDGLKNNDKKQILITPSWRNYLATPIIKIDDTRRYNDNFKNSDYFRIYNNLINNEKLINTAKQFGYKIVYLLHPCTSSQIDDYEKNEFVELIAATDDLNYEKILTESSLMVTDYSGVQFDFAYMYKPIIYFHPNELPPSYEEGEYKYDTMALGEITKTNEETVDLLCEYIKNDCKIKDEYKDRIDKFFKYHDDNNCKRIYDEVMKFRK